MRNILLIGHRYHLEKYMKGFYDAMGKRFSLRIHFVDDFWPSSIKEIIDYEKYDACIWYVRFRDLMNKPAFDWGNYQGLRVMYEEDAHLNFHLMADQSQYLGKWPEVFKRQEFQIMICTGKQTRDGLISEGVNAKWLPKAYDPSRLFDKKAVRDGIGCFGALYGSRKAMLHYLKRNNIEFNYFRCSDQELNLELNKYTGCLICNMAARVKSGFWGLVNRYYPSIGIDLFPGFEPMFKNFEVAGAGCAPIADWIDELAELGFEDGKTVISYESFPELAEKLRFCQANPDYLRDIGRQAYSLAQERHTWDHRAEELENLLFSAQEA